MKEKGNVFTGSRNRRSFLKSGMVAGAATIGATLLPASPEAFAAENDDHAPITKGDIAILTFLSALEQVEADLWIQYGELGGATNQGSRRSTWSSTVRKSSPGWLPITLRLLRFSMATCRNT